MEQCRICLKQMRPKRLNPLFATEKQSNYAQMICTIANVQISDEDGLPNKICLTCSNRVKDAFELKHLAESSDKTLHHGKSKRINFSNINDIKIEIDIVKVEKNVHETNTAFELDFDNKENVIYNDTIIKKVTCNENLIESKSEKKSLSVVELLQNFKDEDEDDHNSCYNDDFQDVEMYGSDTNSNDFDDLPISELHKRKKINEALKGNNEDDDSDYEPCKTTRQKRKYKFVSDKKYLRNGKRKKFTDASHSDPVKKKIRRKPLPKPQALTVSIKPTIVSDTILVFHKKEKTKKSRKKDRVKTLCPYCGLVNPSISHILIHKGEKKFTCDQCNKSFYSAGGLKGHLKKHGPRNYQCDHCTATFYTATSLKSHIKSHSSEKKCICDVCHKAFKRRCTLRRHKMMHNSANKVIKCELCNMSFYEKTNLQHHMRVHTGERPYNCELCSQPYSYKHDFNRHCIKKHGVFLKRRSVNVMNAEVLARERALMQELALKAHGIIKEGDKLNPFEGPQAGLAFEQVITAIQTKQFPVELPIDRASLPYIVFDK